MVMFRVAVELKEVHELLIIILDHLLDIGLFEEILDFL